MLPFCRPLAALEVQLREIMRVNRAGVDAVDRAGKLFETGTEVGG